MKFVTILFATVVLASACHNNAQEKTANPHATTTTSNTAISDPQNYTTIQWVDSVQDMGQITEGQKIEIAFRFRNSGKKPLVIQDVRPSCGCTVADFPKEPLAPGKEGVIKGVFDSAAKPGQNTKTMTVIANTEGNQHHTLSFTVNVIKKG